MSQIIWNASYSVNNAAIDAQHQEWIAIYNRLDRILLQGSNDEVTNAAAEALQAMQDYANYHFRFEEQFLKEINYPDIVAHKRMHTDFDNQVYGYNRNLRNGELVLNSEVIGILKEWLQHHILHEDQTYCAFLKRN